MVNFPIEFEQIMREKAVLPFASKFKGREKMEEKQRKSTFQTKERQENALSAQRRDRRSTLRTKERQEKYSATEGET